VWAHGEIALPYVVLALGSVGLALLFWDARHDGQRRAILASLAFGLAAGFRQDLLLVLGPLWLWSVAAGGAGRVVRCAIAVAGASVLWLVPSAIASGGLDAYVSAVLAQSGTITARSIGSGGSSLWYDARFIILALAWGLFATGVVLLGLLVAPALHWLRGPRLRRPGDLEMFFLLWLVPGLALYLLWIIGDWGYVLSVLPGLYVLCATLLARTLARAHGRPVVVARATLAAIVAGTALFFGVADARWSSSLLAAHDRSVADRVSYVRGHFAVASTVLLAREDYQLARYYLGEYRAWLYDPAPAQITDAPKTIPPAFVIFTPDLTLRQSTTATESAAGLTVLLPSGVKLYGTDPIAREP
jgi:hypothetical protein